MNNTKDSNNKDKWSISISGLSEEEYRVFFKDYPTPNSIVYKKGALMESCVEFVSNLAEEILADSKGVVIKPKPAQPKGNMVVLSASQGDETAYPYKKKKHGMFTYYLLKKLQETSGNTSLGELTDYVKAEVSKQAFKEKNKTQTPSVYNSSELEDWRNITLK